MPGEYEVSYVVYLYKSSASLHSSCILMRQQKKKFRELRVKITVIANVRILANTTTINTGRDTEKKEKFQRPKRNHRPCHSLCIRSHLTPDF